VVIKGYSFHLMDVPHDGNCAIWAAISAVKGITDERQFHLFGNEMTRIRQQVEARMESGGGDVDVPSSYPRAPEGPGVENLRYVRYVGEVLGLQIVVYNAEKCEFYQAFGDGVGRKMDLREALGPALNPKNHYTLFYYSGGHYQLMTPCR
jgi:hypothetical protein